MAKEWKYSKGHFPNNNYLISIVEPVVNLRPQRAEVEVYERLDDFNHNIPTRDAQHFRYIGSFGLWDGEIRLSLDDICEKVKKMVARKKRAG